MLPQQYIESLLDQQKQRMFSESTRNTFPNPRKWSEKGRMQPEISSSEELFAGDEVAYFFHPPLKWFSPPSLGMRSHAHAHTYFEFVFAFSGSFQNAVGDDEFILDTKHVVLLGPGRIHSPYICSEKDIILNILIQPSLMERALSSSVSTHSTVIDFFCNYVFGMPCGTEYLLIHRTPGIERVVESLLYESDEKRPFYQASMFGLIIQLMTELTRSYENQHCHSFDSNTKQPMADILLYLRNHYATVTLQELSERFHYTSDYLSKLIRKETGMGFKDVVLQIKIKNACNLLQNTDLSIGKISCLLGFRDEYYLSRVFKKHFHMSPSAYREQYHVMHFSESED